MKLTTSIALIGENSPNEFLCERLRGDLSNDGAYGLDTPINLLTILDTNGVQDMLYCLRATHQDSTEIARILTIEFAEEVLPIFEARFPDDLRPRKAIQAAKDFMAGKIDDTGMILHVNNDAYDAYKYASKQNNSDAADAAFVAVQAAYTVYDAINAAVAAARNTMHEEKQAEIIRKHLSEN